MLIYKTFITHTQKKNYSKCKKERKFLIVWYQGYLYDHICIMYLHIYEYWLKDVKRENNNE